MNLAQVIEFDYARFDYRIVPERACAPSPRAAHVEPIAVREHHAPERRPTERRPLRAGGKEVMCVLYRAGRPLPWPELVSALPHTKPSTLKVRLSQMSDRGDIACHGERNHFRYCLPAGSTFACT
jgi:hypothetical protein